MPENLPPEMRVLRAKIAAHTRWAKTDDATAATAPGRKAFAARFDREVDPEGILPEAERARRAQSARSAYYSRLAYLSAAARRKRSTKRKQQDPSGEAA